MNALFQEFAKDVLNVETKTMPLSVVPNLFSPFLEEKNQEQGDDIMNLGQKRTYLKSTIRMLQKELQTTNKKLAKKRPEKN
ncbi:hypothetical protein A3K79_00300 [Candidatus Bathyarchaeota archaeon RBG_13_46_16b]|nr:MAG: hypothetical protein A3K79_00300 [Candidatus Bathyarchaeota archaeon RBG_13_46_16b]